MSNLIEYKIKILKCQRSSNYLATSFFGASFAFFILLSFNTFIQILIPIFTLV